MANAGTDLDDDPDAPGGPGDGDDGRRRRDALCARLGHRFADPALLERALAHRSVSARNYERLEFLGDGLLNFAVAAELYRLRPDDDEGSLSRLRASLVRESTLAGIARELALGEHLRLGGGELASGGFERDSILADAIESIVGATFLDAGFEPARALVLRLLGARLANLPSGESLKDPKTRLQEILQGRGLERPVYAVVETRGKDHALRFTVRCTLPSHGRTLRATSTSRRKAEQKAAAEILERLDDYLPPAPGTS